MNLKYRSAQNMLLLIFLMPNFIGWTAWVEILSLNKSKRLEFLINLFKAICIAFFSFYIERMLG